MCWHKWKVWGTDGPSTIGTVMIMLTPPLFLSITAIGAYLMSNGYKDVGAPILATGLVISILSIGLVIAQLDEGFFLRHKDKTCIKCGMHKFDATIAREKKLRKKTTRERLDQIAWKDFKKSQTLFKNIEG